MKNYLIDLERLKYQHTGLFNFDMQLGIWLAKIVSEEERLTYFLPKAFEGHFPSHVGYLPVKSYYKFVFPQTGRFDVFHSTHQTSAYRPSRSDLRIIQTVHDLNFYHEFTHRPEKIARMERLVQAAIRRASDVVAISNFTLRELSERMDLAGKHLHVIYNGCSVDTSYVAPAPRYQPKRNFLFTLGTVLAKKNAHVLPALLAGNNLELVIAGTHPDADYAKKIVNEARLNRAADRVTLTGPITDDEKHWYYAHCKAFLFPSIAEGFGLPVVEAMRHRKPIFLSRLTSLPEIGGPDAFYFDSFEPEHMKAVLEAGLSTFNEVVAETQYQRSFVFSWEKASRDYLALYRKA